MIKTHSGKGAKFKLKIIMLKNDHDNYKVIQLYCTSIYGLCSVNILIKKRFAGFKDPERDRLAKHFTDAYSLEMLDKELSVKGWNWGTAEFTGSVLQFEVCFNQQVCKKKRHS